MKKLFPMILIVLSMSACASFPKPDSSDGFFYSNKMRDGEYKLTKLLIKNDTGKSWAATSMNLNKGSNRIAIKKGCINNLGEIAWYETKNKVVNTKYANYTMNNNYGKCAKLLRTKDKKDNWKNNEAVNSEWKN